jgi:hypothetical protein
MLSRSMFAVAFSASLEGESSRGKERLGVGHAETREGVRICNITPAD